MDERTRRNLHDQETLEILREHAVVLASPTTPPADLVAAAGRRHFALIGEASHGTHDFYAMRAEITRQLIADHGFRAVCIEGDWPDAWRVDRYVRHRSDARSAEEALRGFQRFPQWMWRNRDVVDFIEWLHDHNAALSDEEQCAFYGLDLYSMHTSMRAVLEYLERVDPEAARRARFRYACFDHAREDPQAYGYAASIDATKRCEDEAVQQLVELRKRELEYTLKEDGSRAFFSAEMNARLVANAEEYYRSMFRGRVSSWNLRDTHMMETLGEITAHELARTKEPKIAVWAHNSHLGDARFTEMGAGGELNLGQLVRQKHGKDAMLIGFTTHAGTVTAAFDWDEPAERKIVRASLPGSVERLLHDTGRGDFWLDLERDPVRTALAGPLLERAIGVIYRPETERMSHYFNSAVSHQFDALMHIDRTTALEPLERTPMWEAGEELPETYPSAL